LERRTEGQWAVIEVGGELDLDSAPALGEALALASGSPGAQVAVDLSNVSFMDSSALGVLVTGLKRIKDGEGELVLVGVNGSPGKVLSLTGLDRVFRLEPSIAALIQ
jgi:anti-sigma B factor antagonist